MRNQRIIFNLKPWGKSKQEFNGSAHRSSLGILVQAASAICSLGCYQQRYRVIESFEGFFLTGPWLQCTTRIAVRDMSPSSKVWEWKSPDAMCSPSVPHYMAALPTYMFWVYKLTMLFCCYYPQFCVALPAKLACLLHLALYQETVNV